MVGASIVLSILAILVAGATYAELLEEKKARQEEREQLVLAYGEIKGTVSAMADSINRISQTYIQ